MKLRLTRGITDKGATSVASGATDAKARNCDEQGMEHLTERSNEAGEQ